MSTGRWGASVGLKEKEEKKRQKLRPEAVGRWGQSLRWDEDEEDEEVYSYEDKIITGGESTYQEEETVILKDEKEKEKKPGFFKKAIDAAKSFLGYDEEPPSEEEIQKIEAVYNSRTPESVKHSAEIEVAEIDQKVSEMKADQAVIFEYLKYDPSNMTYRDRESRTPEQIQKEEELRQKADEIRKKYIGGEEPLSFSGYSGFAFNTLEEDIDDLRKSKRKLEMVVENQETGASNKILDILKEFVPGLTDRETIPGGLGALFGLSFQVEENRVADKIEAGEKLTPEEEVIEKRIIAKREYEKRDISDLQAGAQSIPGSLSMSIDFMLLGGTTKGLTGIPKYLAAAQKATKVAFSTQLPRMFEQFAERVGSEYETKPTEDGGFELVKMEEGEVPTTAAILSVANVFANTQVEALGGEFLDDALGFIYKPLAKKFPKIGASEALKKSKAFEVLQKLYKSENLRTYVQRQSPFGELFEEFVQSQVDKLTYGEPLGLSGEEAKRITISTLMMSLILAPLGLTDLKRGDSRELTSEDLENLPSGLRQEVEQELAGREVVDQDDMKEVAEGIIEKIESGEITKEALVAEGGEEGVTLYTGQDGEVQEIQKTYAEDRTLVRDNQVEVLRDLAEEGDEVARELLYGEGDQERSTIDYAKADYYIQEALQDKYDVVVYERSDIKDEVQEYHDLKENKFYSTNKDLAKSYANQTRGEKYEMPEFKEFEQRVSEYKGRKIETKKDTLSNKEVANILVEMGTNDANGSLEPVAEDDFVITNQVMSSPSYRLQTLKVEEVLENNKDLQELLEDPEAFLGEREYIEEQDNYDSPIIVDNKGEIIDGVGRLAGHLVNNDTEIQAYVGVSEETVPAEVKKTPKENLQVEGEVQEEGFPEEWNEQAEMVYDKDFEDLTPVQSVKLLAEMTDSGENQFFETTDEELLKKLGRGVGTMRASDVDLKESVFIWKGEEEKMYTDAMILFTDPEESLSIIKKFQKQIVNKEAKKLQKSKDISLAEAKIQIRKEKVENAKDIEFPEVKQILEKAKLTHELTPVGYYIENRRETGSILLEGPEGNYKRISGKYYYEIMNRYPDAKLYVAQEGEAEPMAFAVNGERKGVVMPMMLGDSLEVMTSEKEEIKLKGAKGASVDVFGEEEVKFLNALKNFRSKETSVEKIDSINTALEEYSPTLAPNHEFTQEEVTARAERIRTMPALDLTEIVGIVNSLTDKELLTVVKKFRGGAGTRGMFRHKGDEAVSIEVLAALFADPEIASKTVAHEIGHFVDFLPDNKMAGTFASKVAGLKTMGKNFGEFKDATMREEIYALSKDVWRPYAEGSATQSYINYRRSGEELYADFMSMLFMDPALLKQKAPHTLEAWVSFLENKPEAKKAFDEAWDLMLETGDERYDKRAKSVREMFAEGDKKLWGSAEVDQINKRTNASFYLLTAWKGVKEATIELRTKVVDIKTPLIEIEKKAEKRLGRKLTTEEKITKQIETLQKMQSIERTFIDTYYDPIKRRLDAEGLSWELMGEYQFYNRIAKERGDITTEEVLTSLEDVSLLDIFTDNDKNKDPDFKKVLRRIDKKRDPMLNDFIKEGIGRGESISGVIKDLKQGISLALFGEKGPTTKSEVKVQKALDNGGLGKRLASYLPMKAGVANPLGFTTKTAQQQIGYMQRELGDKKFELLKQIAEKDFRAGSMALLELEGAKDYFGESKIEQIKKNDAYVTFAVNYYLDKYIPATIRRQAGTLKGVANVSTATALKNTSLLRAIEFNQMKKNAVEFIRQNDQEVIKPAPTRYDAGLGYQVLDHGEVARMRGWEVLYYMDQGKLRHVMLAEETFNAVTERIAGGNFFGLKFLETLNNKVYRPIFVARNLAFNIFNVPRDFLRGWKNSSWVNFVEYTSSYIKAMGLAKKSVFRKEDADIIKEMKRKGMLGFYRTDVYEDSSSETSANLFQMYETKAGEKKAKGLKEKYNKALKTLDNITEMFEMIPKVTGKITLDHKKVFENDADARDMIVNYIGSPNFQNKGEWYRWYNNLWLFANATKEGWKGDIEVYTGKSPTGKKGSMTAILRSIEMSVIPTILSYMIRHGMPPFDDDDSMWGDLRRLLEGIPTRDFFGFTCIPVGEVMGKTVYLPLARPETEQLISAITWNIMEAINGGDLQDVGESLINEIKSQFPSIHPLIQSGEAIIQAAAGENPYDRFRQRNVFNPYTFNTMSSGEKTQELIEYIGSLNGMNSIIRSYDPRTYGEGASALEKAHQIPFLGNALNRILRVSNYGIIETSYKEQLKDEKEAAQLKKEREAMINEDAKLLVEQNASLKDIDNKLKEYEEAAIGYARPKGGYKGDDRLISNQLRKLLKEELVKESDTLPSWRVIDANTNDQKESILLREKENLSDTQFTNYLRNLRNSEIISDQFVKSLLEKGHISKSQYETIVKGDRFKFHPFY